MVWQPLVRWLDVRSGPGSLAALPLEPLHPAWQQSVWLSDCSHAPGMHPAATAGGNSDAMLCGLQLLLLFILVTAGTASATARHRAGMAATVACRCRLLKTTLQTGWQVMMVSMHLLLTRTLFMVCCTLRSRQSLRPRGTPRVHSPQGCP